VKRRPDQTESLLWFCDHCDAPLHAVTMHVADIETELRTAIEDFDRSPERRICRRCRHVQPEQALVPRDPLAATTHARQR
jgi:3-hydroxyanthranilate 3,4-dioxygenase